MPKYATMKAAFATTTGTLTVLGGYMLTNADRNAEVVELIMTGSGDTAAADIMHRCDWSMLSFTATGASSTITPIPFNSTSAAAKGNWGAAYSTEPTAYSAVHNVTFGFNQRGGMRWAVPQGEGIRLNGGTSTLLFYGGGQTVKSSAVGTVDANLHFWQD